MSIGGPFCCCGPFKTNVETGAKVIAIFGIVSGLVGAISSLFVHPASAVGFLLSTLLYLLVLYAQRRRNPSLYLPYLILGALSLLAVLVTSVVLSASGYLPYAAICVLNLLLGVWFYSIVYRAYKALKEEMAAGTSAQNPKV